MESAGRRLAGYFLIGSFCLVVGYFAGREHLKYELRTALQSAAQEMQKSLGSIGDVASEPPKEKEQAAPSAPKKESPMGAVLTKKGFIASDWQAGTYEDAITFAVSFTNLTGKDIRAFDGVLSFTDLLDNKILASTLAINDPVAAGATFEWEGQLVYNQFMDSHQRLRAEDRANLKITFTVRKVLFADGSVTENE